MAVRFNCVACSQPIEVDDQWALKVVACPYCRRTMTAPRESMLGDLAQIPMATAITRRPELSDILVAAGPPPRSGDGANRFAVAALVFGLGAIILVTGTFLIFGAHLAELSELQKSLEAGQTPMESMRRFLDAQGGSFPTWFVAGEFLQVAAIGAAITSIVCGIIGVRVPRRRGLAVAALVLSGGFVLVFCAGLVNVLGSILSPIAK